MIDEKDLMAGDFVCYDKANGYVTKVIDIRRYGVAETGYEYAITAIRDKRDPLYSGYEELFNVQILSPIDITDDELFGTMDDNYRKYRVWLGNLDSFFVEKCTGCWNHSCPGCYDGHAREVCEVFQKEVR